MKDHKDEIRKFAQAYKYNLKPLAVSRFASFLKKYDTGEEYRRGLLRDLFSLIGEQCCDNRLVDELKADAVISLQEARIKGCLGADGSSSVQVVSLGAVPKVFVDEVSNELRVSSSSAALNRLQCLNQRYALARRRCFRCGLYQKSVDQRAPHDGSLALLPTSALEGLDPGLQVAVLGLLVVRDDEVFLEDLRGQIKLKFSEQSRVTQHCFLGNGFLAVVSGFWVNSILQVTRVDLPPAERREVTLRDAGSSMDLFGLAPRNPMEALREEKKRLQSVIIVMAHVHLDKAGTMSKLARFFERMQGLSESELRDVTFVFTGDFSSVPLHFSDASHLPDIFDNSNRLQILLDGLGRCIAANAPTAAQHSHFVLIPGPSDMTALQGFQPQTPIATQFAKGVESRTKKLTLAPNPCRLRFHTHEVIIARRDFLRDLQHGELLYPWDRYRTKERTDAALDQGAPSGGGAATTTSFERVTKTLLDEAHLSPSIDEAVLWRADDALRIPVLPHTMLLCDSTEQWECHYKGVHVVNPGSFGVNGTFLWYTPADGQCSLNRLD
ncbi:putative DNA polymerase epsilon subunit b [Leishmania mexicana MHOM/GT/2001/U1103]|uniref:DNA polymerase II subunit 2 n=1 Tax=Leishmania mexicana (strain MHOM/GT/2001/U1103) TaxID=929439 RepID=E9B656_LEIMU|nr:putative DNA polymerase epsilon subunit b [Leishmania mexicana MHOM/GT/2001/U1103]CBZ30727.1 putative DNA polymerase epsilon subunit b [Leishmania mexicana MHOM/GT/2001/U1103]